MLRRRGYRLGSPGRLPRISAAASVPRWREYKARGVFISARIFRAAFGADRRQDIAKYVIAVEVSGLVMLATGV